MCQGRVDFESITLSHLIPFQEYFAAELEMLKPMVEGGLVEIDADGIQVTASGWYFVRGVAMVFDRHLRADQTRERFSRIV
jgi:oxygen-independent coproporphyrinogen-3 oxidase